MIRTLLLFGLLVFCVFHTFAQTTWIGTTSTDWSTASNWNPNVVPTASTDVIIPDVNNDPFIGVGVAALANSVEVQPGSSLSLITGGTLTINGSKRISGPSANGTTLAFYNLGIVDNAGKLVIGNLSSVGDYGIYNRGTLHNNTGGQIQIDRSTESAIYNDEGSSFTNAAGIDIGSKASAGFYGIRNRALFQNNLGGTLQIDQSTSACLFNQNGSFINAASVKFGSRNPIGSYGISNLATIQNSTGALIQIDRSINTGLINTGPFTNAGRMLIGSIASVGEYGFYNMASFINNAGGSVQIDRSTFHGLDNIGDLTNEATILIGSIASVGNCGLYNQGGFNNNTGGSIQIDRSTQYGLYSNEFSKFNNAASISIGATVSVGNTGLHSLGIFQNNPGGTIHIDRSSTYGLYCKFGTFTNKASLIIGATAGVGTYGFFNDGAPFLNSSCATLSLFAPLNNLGTFTNQGLFRVNVTQAHLNSGLTNNGIIVYAQSNPIPNVTNNDLIILPITTACNLTASPALQIGGSSSFTVGSTWYKEPTLTTVAGTYSPNTFTATDLASGSTYPLSFTVAEPANGCVHTVTIPVTVNGFLATAGSASNTVVVGSAVYLSATGGSTYQWLAPAGASLSSPVTSSLVSATLTSPGLQTFSAIVTKGGCNQTLTVGVTAVVPSDLATIFYASPALIYGSSICSIVVDVVDVKNTPTNGLITLYITKDPLLTLSLTETAIFAGGRPVQNSAWNLDGVSDPSFYILTTSQSIGAKGKLSVGLSGQLSPGNTKGNLAVSGLLIGNDIGEVNGLNNAGAVQIDYFNK